MHCTGLVLPGTSKRLSGASYVHVEFFSYEWVGHASLNSARVVLREQALGAFLAPLRHIASMLCSACVDTLTSSDS